MARATGESRKQSGLINQLTKMNPAEDAHTRDHPTRFETSLCRPAVRGFSWSISQSATLLNAMAAVRAKTMAERMSRTSLTLGNPCAETIIDPAANGSAKTVWENLMNFRMRWM